MLVFDIHQIPNDLIIDTWYNLYKEGLVLYDSMLPGAKPFVTDDDKLFLIDVQTMTDQQWDTVLDASAKINSRSQEEQERDREILQHNNIKLVEYLKKLNSDNS